MKTMAVGRLYNVVKCQNVFGVFFFASRMQECLHWGAIMLRNLIAADLFNIFLFLWNTLKNKTH